MRFTEEEYLKIGQELTLLISQALTLGNTIANAFPRKHKINRIANRTIPAPNLNENLLHFREELENWYCQDFSTAANPVGDFNRRDKQCQKQGLEGVHSLLSKAFFSIRDAKRLQMTRKKPGLNRLEIIVSILFFRHLGDRISHLAMGAIERNFPAKNAAKFAKSYLNAVRELNHALQEELANTENEGNTANGI